MNTGTSGPVEAGAFEGFNSIDLEDPVRVNSTLEEQRAVTIVFQGDHAVLGKGVYSARLNFFGEGPDQFDPDEAERIMEFLTHPERPWGLVVASRNLGWTKGCSQILELQNGKLIRKK